MGDPYPGQPWGGHESGGDSASVYRPNSVLWSDSKQESANSREAALNGEVQGNSLYFRKVLFPDYTWLFCCVNYSLLATIEKYEEITG